MSFSFQHHHGAMLLKYSGISFISGAVNHGFFSGERSLWTAAIGMVLFVIGAAMEHRLSDSEAEAPNSLMRTLALGALLSIGLGFFTGGLQHFPDSPARSAWVVPLGFFISVLALTMSSAHPWQRSTTVYVALVGALVSAGSYGAWQWLERHPEWAATGHSHGPTDSGHGDAHDHAGPPSGTNAMVVSRSIDVRMDDRMRFTPDRLEVQAGETIRFVCTTPVAAFTRWCWVPRRRSVPMRKPCSKAPRSRTTAMSRVWPSRLSLEKQASWWCGLIVRAAGKSLA